MENKKEGILKKFWSKLKNFWNKLENFWSNLGTDVEGYTDEEFQEEIDKRGMDALQYKSADNCAVDVANRGEHRASEKKFKNKQHISGHIVKNGNKTGIAYENERE